MPLKTLLYSQIFIEIMKNILGAKMLKNHENFENCYEICSSFYKTLDKFRDFLASLTIFFTDFWDFKLYQ